MWHCANECGRTHDHDTPEPELCKVCRVERELEAAIIMRDEWREAAERAAKREAAVRANWSRTMHERDGLLDRCHDLERERDEWRRRHEQYRDERGDHQQAYTDQVYDDPAEWTTMQVPEHLEPLIALPDHAAELEAAKEVLVELQRERDELRERLARERDEARRLAEHWRTRARMMSSYPEREQPHRWRLPWDHDGSGDISSADDSRLTLEQLETKYADGCPICGAHCKPGTACVRTPECWAALGVVGVMDSDLGPEGEEE